MHLTKQFQKAQINQNENDKFWNKHLQSKCGWLFNANNLVFVTISDDFDEKIELRCKLSSVFKYTILIKSLPKVKVFCWKTALEKH